MRPCIFHSLVFNRHPLIIWQLMMWTLSSIWKWFDQDQLRNQTKNKVKIFLMYPTNRTTGGCFFTRYTRESSNNVRRPPNPVVTGEDGNFSFFSEMQYDYSKKLFVHSQFKIMMLSYLLDEQKLFLSSSCFSCCSETFEHVIYFSCGSKYTREKK